MKFKEKVELINKIVINTYQQIAECGGITQHQAFEQVEELKRENILDTACCPLCSEVMCDGGCPFEDIRPDGGNPKYSKDYDK